MIEISVNAAIRTLVRTTRVGRDPLKATSRQILGQFDWNMNAALTKAFPSSHGAVTSNMNSSYGPLQFDAVSLQQMWNRIPEAV